MPQLVTMKISDITIKPQVRREFDTKLLDELVESIRRHGVLQPPLVTEARELLAGGRRLIAADRAGLKEIQVIISDKVLSDTEIRVIQLTENLHRAELSGNEKWRTFAELMRMNPSMQIKQLAEMVSLDASTCTRILSPSKCTAAWQDALAAGKVGISDCYAASKLPEKDQAALLSLKLSGASRDQLEHAGRKTRNSKPSAVRLSRVKIVMKGSTLLITGGDLGMTEVVELLSEILREARKAAEQYDVKTLQSMMRDRAKGVNHVEVQR